MRYSEIIEASPPIQPADIASLVTWGDQMGVEATIEERKTRIDLFDITRLPRAAKGSGAVFMHALCAYADQHRKPIMLTVTGSNSQLEDYYHGFGFRVREASRDEETGDVTMVRSFRRPSMRSLAEASPGTSHGADIPGVIKDRTGKPKRFYHGTVDEFPEFDPRKVHDKAGTKLKLGFGPGVLYFTDHPDDAHRYAARHQRDGANIRPVYLIMHKPLVIKHWDSDNAGWLNAAAYGRGSFASIKSYATRMRKFIRDVRAEGFDGIIQGDGSGPMEYVVFGRDQVISLFDARGVALQTESLSNPSLTEASRPSPDVSYYMDVEIYA